MAEYLAHYGTKGMRWGVRRYQNPDGTLTDEGRRHYGYGTKDLITKNTKQHIKRDALLGAIINGAPPAIASGMLAGSAAQGLTMLGASVLGGPIGAAAISAGATFILNAPQGAALGAGVGAIVGSVSTKLGRRYIEANDTGLGEFIERERNKEASKSSIDKVASWVEENHASRLEAEEKHLSENLKGYRDDIVSAMSSYIQGSDDKKVKDSDIAEFLKDCAWIENSKDPDHIIDQRMSEYIDLYKQGKITNRQFSDMYESELSRAAAEIAYYGTKDIKRIRNMDPEYPDRTYEHYLSSLGIEVRKDSIPGHRWGMRRYQNSDGSLTEAGKARYKNRQSSGRYSYGTRESTKRGFVEIASKDSKNWKPISSKSGEREYEYIGPSGERAQAKAFRAADYTYAEIADMMNISESKVYDLLNK